MRTLVGLSYLGLILVVWPLARSITRLEVFRTMEREHQNYYNRLDARAVDSHLLEEAPDCASLRFGDMVAFSRSSEYAVMRETWKTLEKKHLFFFNMAGGGLVILGLVALFACRITNVRGRHAVC